MKPAQFSLDSPFIRIYSIKCCGSILVDLGRADYIVERFIQQEINYSKIKSNHYGRWRISRYRYLCCIVQVREWGRGDFRQVISILITISTHSPHITISSHSPHITIPTHFPHITISRHSPHITISTHSPKITIPTHFPHITISTHSKSNKAHQRHISNSIFQFGLQNMQQ